MPGALTRADRGTTMMVALRFRIRYPIKARETEDSSGLRNGSAQQEESHEKHEDLLDAN